MGEAGPGEVAVERDEGPDRRDVVHWRCPGCRTAVRSAAGREGVGTCPGCRSKLKVGNWVRIDADDGSDRADAVYFACGCGAELMAAARLAGGKGPCAGCRKVVPVPARADIELAARRPVLGTGRGECPCCQAQLQCPTAHAGGWGKCPACRRAITLNRPKSGGSAPPPGGGTAPATAGARRVPVLEPAGAWDAVKAGWAAGQGRAPAGTVTCPGCQARLKRPAGAGGRHGACPKCRKVLRLPIAGSVEEIVREVAAALRLDPSNPTVHQALDHCVRVLHPSAGTGGTLSFLQARIIADQVRENGTQVSADLRAGHEALVRMAKETGLPVEMPPPAGELNRDDPLVIAAGTPWRLCRWLAVEFGGRHGKAVFEGHVGHPNPEVNAACFVAMTNRAYPDDRCEEYSDAMLANLLRLANAHADAAIERQDRRRDTAPAPVIMPPPVPPPPAPPPPPAVRERKCDACYGKGWIDPGYRTERRCSSCGGQGVIRS